MRLRTKLSRFFLQPRGRIHTCHARSHAPFSWHLLVNDLGHLGIRHEKRDTCPIRSFRIFFPRLTTLAVRFTSHPRESRNTLAIQGPHQLPPPSLTTWPASQMSPSRWQVVNFKTCGSPPRATVATFAKASPATHAFSLRSRDFAMAVYGRERRPSADLSDWDSRDIVV